MLSIAFKVRQDKHLKYKLLIYHIEVFSQHFLIWLRDWYLLIVSKHYRLLGGLLVDLVLETDSHSGTGTLS